MKRYILMGLALLVLASTIAYAAPFGSTPTVKAIAGGTTVVNHISGSVCQLEASEAAGSITGGSTGTVINTVNVTVNCDATGSYLTEVTVTSGASTSVNSSTDSLTANTPQVVSITISPTVNTNVPDTYSLSYTVTKQ